MFYHNFTETDGHRVLAVCDKDLLGTVLEDSRIKFEVKKSFYGEESIDEEGLLEKAEKSSIINAVGSRSVSLLVENDFFDGDRILKIDGVEHAQMVKI